MVSPVAEGSAVAFRASWRLSAKHQRIRFRGPTNMRTFQIRMTADDHAQACLDERPGRKYRPSSVSISGQACRMALTPKPACTIFRAGRHLLFSTESVFRQQIRCWLSQPSSSANKSLASRRRHVPGMYLKMALPPQAWSHTVQRRPQRK